MKDQRGRGFVWPLADELTTRPWGLTDFRVFDPAGQYIRITNTTAEG